MLTAGQTLLWVSLNEIETTTLKAARSAGYSWGMAEEAGRACRWLAMRGLPWLRPLTDGVLSQLHRLESFDSAKRTGSTFGPSDQLRSLGPISVLVALSDEIIPLPPPSAELSWRNLAAPVLLLPALTRLSKRFDKPILIRWPGVALECRAGEIFTDGAGRNCLEATAADWVTITRDNSGPAIIRGSISTVRHQGAEVSALQWRGLLAIAEPTHIPEAETSRLTGAGTGHTDNE